MSAVYSANFDAEIVGSIAADWINIGGADYRVGTRTPVSGSRSFGENASPTTPGQIALYTGVSARRDMVVQTSQIVQLDGSNNGGASATVLRSNVSGTALYLFASLFGPSSNVYLMKLVSGSYTVLNGGGLGTAHGLTFSNGDTAMLKAEIVGSTLRIKVWKSTSVEPATWTDSITDTTYTAAGYCGLYAGYNGTSGGATFSQCDDFKFGTPGSNFNGSVLYHETFDTLSGAVTGWTNIAPATWQATNTRPALLSDKGFHEASNSGNGQIALYTGIAARTDSVLQLAQKIRITGGHFGTIGAAVRMSIDGQNGYLLVLDPITPKAYVFKRVSGTYTVINPQGLATGTDPGITFSDGDDVWFKLECYSTTIRWKIWKTSAVEPDAWTETITDSSISATGYCGVYMGTDTNLQVSADNIYIGTPGTHFGPEVVNTIVSGQNCQVLIPPSYVHGTQTPFVLHGHGAGESQDIFGNPTVSRYRMGIMHRLIDDGYVIGSSNMHGDNWGNQNSINDIVTLDTYLAEHFTAGQRILSGQSMSGLATLHVLSAGSIPNIACWFGLVPVCDLANLFAANAGTFSSAIRTAYGIASDGSDYVTKTAGYNPILLTASTYNKRMRFYSSSGDTVVNEAANSTAMAAYCTSAPVHTVVECSGDHGDVSQFQPADVSAFIAASFGPSTTGTLIISETVGNNTASVTVATPTFTITSPTSGLRGQFPTLSITGTNTLWTHESLSTLLSISGGTGASLGSVTVNSDTSISVQLTGGSGTGILTITDNSTGQSDTFDVAAATSYILSGLTNILFDVAKTYTITPNGDSTGIVFSLSTDKDGTFNVPSVTGSSSTPLQFTYTANQFEDSPHTITATDNSTLTGIPDHLVITVVDQETQDVVLRANPDNVVRLGGVTVRGPGRTINYSGRSESNEDGDLPVQHEQKLTSRFDDPRFYGFKR